MRGDFGGLNLIFSLVGGEMGVVKPSLPTSNLIWEFSGGEFVPAASGIPLTDRGFRYGLHSFETLRVKNGRAEFREEHLALLKQSPWAGGFSEWNYVADWLSQPFPPEGMLRLYLTAGDGALTTAAGDSRFYAWFEPREFTALPESLTATLAPDPVWPQPGSGKTGNYYPNLAARDAAKALGFDEALLFDRDDQLVGASLANVFYGRGGKLFTPPAGRPGVVRGWVKQQTEVTERPLLRSEIREIEFVFLTSSGIGIMPIRAIESRALAGWPLLDSFRSALAGH